MTFGRFLQNQFMGTQGKRNLNFARSKGRLYMPKFTKRAESTVRKGRKWIDAIGGIGKEVTSGLDALQRTDLPGVFNAAESGVKKTIGLGKEIVNDPNVRAAAAGVKKGVKRGAAAVGRVFKGGKKRKFGATTSMVESGPKRGLSPESMSRIVQAMG